MSRYINLETMFLTDEERAARRKAGAKKAAATRARRKAEEDVVAATMEPVKVGDIFSASWGYDQTNVDFYEVLSVSKTGKTAKVVKVNGRIVDEDRNITHVVATPGTGNDEQAFTVHLRPTTWRGQPDWYFRVASYASASRWHGEPLYETASGWGH